MFESFAFGDWIHARTHKLIRIYLNLRVSGTQKRLEITLFFGLFQNQMFPNNSRSPFESVQTNCLFWVLFVPLKWFQKGRRGCYGNGEGVSQLIYLDRLDRAICILCYLLTRTELAMETIGLGSIWNFFLLLQTFLRTGNMNPGQTLREESPWTLGPILGFWNERKNTFRLPLICMSKKLLEFSHEIPCKFKQKI